MINKAVFSVPIATLGIIGKLPVSPGSFGSLAALPFCYLISYLSRPHALLFTAGFILFAILVAHAAEQHLQQKDPCCIVIDEVVGMLITFIGLPFDWYYAIGGFLAFRFFDILKPYPIRWMETRLRGGLGIVADDLMAGFYANIALRLGEMLLTQVGS